MTIRLTRRKALPLVGGALAAPLLPSISAAQAGLPEGTLKIIVGFPAGGGTDVMARLIAEPLKQRTGRNIIIDNRGGASGTIGAEAVKNAPPDGSTIIYIPSATIVQKLTMASVPFDPLKDFTPLTQAGTVQTAFCVSPTIGVNTLPEYVAWLKKNPTRASFGTTALGSFTHFFGVMVGREVGVPLEPVPYRGAAPLVADLQGGHIAAGCGGLTDFLEHHRAGKVKLLLTSGTQPAQASPDVPTGVSLGYPNLNILGWYIFLGPAKMSPELVQAWNTELSAAIKLPDVTRRLIELGLDVETSSPDYVRELMAKDLARWKTIIDGIGYKPQ